MVRRIPVPIKALEFFAFFLYGVNMILILLCKVCEEMLENYQNLTVRMYGWDV